MMQAAFARHEHSLSSLLAGLAQVSEDCTITGLSMDSRAAHDGDLFLACAGGQTHGVHFIEDAIEAGVAAVAWEPVGDARAPATSQQVPMVAVENLGKLVGIIADRFYGHPSQALFVIGITGTNGKTSCAQFISRALQQSGRSCGVIGTLGYGLVDKQQSASHTTPDALRLHALLAQMREQGAECVVMEVSSHGLDQGRVNGVAFDVALFTNLSRDHLDYHGDEQSYRQAKRRLFEYRGLGYAVINGDDAYGQELLASLGAEVQTVVYGFAQESHRKHARWVSGSRLSLSAEGISFRVESSWGSGSVQSPLLGAFNASNLLAALSVLLLMDISIDDACRLIGALGTVPGRMERYGDVSSQPLVVVDYAHTPDALKLVLQALRGHVDGKLWCVFGCGGNRDRGKRPIMAAEAERHADCVVVTDDNPRSEDPDQIVAEIMQGFSQPDQVMVLRDRKQAIQYALQSARTGDIVLVAGKGHEEYQLLGEQKIPFSDCAVVQGLLRGDA